MAFMTLLDAATADAADAPTDALVAPLSLAFETVCFDCGDGLGGAVGAAAAAAAAIRETAALVVLSADGGGSAAEACIAAVDAELLGPAAVGEGADA